LDQRKHGKRAGKNESLGRKSLWRKSRTGFQNLETMNPVGEQIWHNWVLIRGHPRVKGLVKVVHTSSRKADEGKETGKETTK